MLYGIYLPVGVCERGNEGHGTFHGVRLFMSTCLACRRADLALVRLLFYSPYRALVSTCSSACAESSFTKIVVFCADEMALDFLGHGHNTFLLKYVLVQRTNYMATGATAVRLFAWSTPVLGPLLHGN